MEGKVRRPFVEGIKRGPEAVPWSRDGSLDERLRTWLVEPYAKIEQETIQSSTDGNCLIRGIIHSHCFR